MFTDEELAFIEDLVGGYTVSYGAADAYELKLGTTILTKIDEALNG